MRILGVDPGLRKTGWGIIEKQGQTLRYIACGTIKPDTTLPLSERLAALHDGLQDIITSFSPDGASLEETFVNASGQSTLKLGQARGALLLSLAIANLQVGEYAPNQVKKTLTGVGRADKAQVALMVQTLLPQGKAEIAEAGEDAVDALALAICHAHSIG